MVPSCIDSLTRLSTSSRSCEHGYSISRTIQNQYHLPDLRCVYNWHKDDPILPLK